MKLPKLTGGWVMLVFLASVILLITVLKVFVF